MFVEIKLLNTIYVTSVCVCVCVCVCDSENRKISSPKGNDRSPENQQVISNSSQVNERVFSFGQGQLTPQSMVESGQIINSFETI